MQPLSLQVPLFAHFLDGLELVTDLEVLEIFQHDTTLVTLAHL